jgi:hypothetical protein
VLQRRPLQADLDHLATRFVHGLLNGHRHLARLALAHADTAVAIAHYRERRETENPATLDDFRHPVDRDHLFFQSVVALFAADPCLNLRHVRIPLFRTSGQLRGRPRPAP